MGSRNKKDICEVFCINQKKVDAIRKVMQTDGVVKKLAQTFKVLGDPTRTKILYALTQDELCVCDLALVGKDSIRYFTSTPYPAKSRPG